jgi:hypothetical protein
MAAIGVATAAMLAIRIDHEARMDVKLARTEERVAIEESGAAHRQ